MREKPTSKSTAPKKTAPQKSPSGSAKKSAPARKTSAPKSTSSGKTAPKKSPSESAKKPAPERKTSTPKSTLSGKTTPKKSPSESAKKPAPARKTSAVGKIFKTTDGNLGNLSPKNKKPRKVVAVEQRKSDGAIAVAKIHKKEGKDPKDRSKYIQGVELDPKRHPSLTKPSIVEKRAIFGTKDSEKKYKPIYPTDVEDTGDKLKGRELCKVRKGIQNDTKEHRKSYKKTKRRWKKSFKE